jgi:hypothetical protein
MEKIVTTMKPNSETPKSLMEKARVSETEKVLMSKSKVKAMLICFFITKELSTMCFFLQNRQPAFCL